MSTQPDWHDAPTCAGDWLCDFGDCERSEWIVSVITDWHLQNAHIYRHGARYYGPIPTDTKAPDAT